MAVSERVVDVPIADLRRHHFSSVRSIEVSEHYVDLYGEHFASLPPPVVWWTGRRFECLDGRHRVAAGRKLGRTSLRCRVFEGTEEEALLYALSVNTQHGQTLSHDDRNLAIKRALRLGLTLSSREMAALFNCSHTHVQHMQRLIEVEQGYKHYLDNEGVPPREQEERLRRLERWSDRVVLKVHEAPREHWGALLDSLPTDRGGWMTESAVDNALAQLHGSTSAPAPPDTPTGEPPSAQPAAGDAVAQTPDPVVDQMAQAVADDHQAARRRRSEAASFGVKLEQVERITREVEQLLPLIVQLCTPGQQAAAESISEVWRAVAEGAAQYQQQQRTRAAGDPAPDEDLPFTG